MKSIIFFSVLFFISSILNAKTDVCSSYIRGQKFGEYTFQLQGHECEQRHDCWIHFKAPEDTFSLKLGGSEIFNLKNTNDYVFNEYFLVPIPSTLQLSNLVILTKDINQISSAPQNICMTFGSHNNLRWLNASRWFWSTGINLFSAYFLLLISFFLAFSFWFRQSGLGFSLLVYSLVSCAYLISFSEYPRALLNPILASGAFHFPLRLLQDLSLVLVFYNFYQRQDSYNVIKKISFVYVLTISVYLLMLMIGVRDYIYHSRLIIIMAPLVAAPMAIGAWFSLRTKDPFEKKVLVPVSFLLLCFQINDLLVFWKLVQSYFTVKFYIPFIVGMLLFLYFRRMHSDSLKVNLYNERQKIFKAFLHDVRSPLAVLKVFFASLNENIERQRLMQMAFDRIEGMFSQINDPNKDKNEKLNLSQIILEIIKLKKIEYPDFSFTVTGVTDVFIWADKSKLERLLSNLINNAYDSYDLGPKSMEVNFLVGGEEVKVLLTDKGKGIPKAICNKLLKDNFTTKIDGQGIGLFTANEYLRQIDGRLNILSKEKVGTTIELQFKTLPGDIKLTNIEHGKKHAGLRPDLILIDDDKYIRLSWEYYAKNIKKVIWTYSNLDDFFKDSEFIYKTCPIYLDLNLNGELSTQFLGEFERLGFTNIVMATGENIGMDKMPKIVQSISGKLPPIH